MLKTFTYIYKEKEYNVEITRKRMRTIRYRFKNDTFYVSCSSLVGKRDIIKGLDKYAESLIKYDLRFKGMDDKNIYIFGNKLSIPKNNQITFSDGSVICYVDEKDLQKKLKKLLLKVIEPRVRYYECLMGIRNPYKVKVKKMTSRYGSNSSRTRSIAFTTSLIHYSSYIIDAIIVHELAHDFYRDHSKNFYNVVFKYYPDYNIYIKKLKKGIFA